MNNTKYSNEVLKAFELLYNVNEETCRLQEDARYYENKAYMNRARECKKEAELSYERGEAMFKILKALNLNGDYIRYEGERYRKEVLRLGE